MNHEEFLPEILEAARSASRGYPVEVEDVRQEALLAFYTRAEEIAEAEEDGRADVVRRIVRTAVQRYCRREKAELEGYEVMDEFAYTPKMVEGLLPAAFEYAASGSFPQPAVNERVSGGSGKPSDGRNIQVMLLDVLEGLRGAEGDLLHMRFAEEMDLASVGERLGVDEDAARHRVGRAVRKVCAALNDHRARADSEHDGPGSRRSLGTAEARAMVSDDMPASGRFARPRRVLRRVAAHDQPELQ